MRERERKRERESWGKVVPLVLMAEIFVFRRYLLPL